MSIDALTTARSCHSVRSALHVGIRGLASHGMAAMHTPTERCTAGCRHGVGSHRRQHVAEARHLQHYAHGRHMQSGLWQPARNEDCKLVCTEGQRQSRP